MNPDDVRLDDDPDAATLEAIDRGLDEANARAAPTLADVRTLAVAARTAGGAPVGGAVGRTWGHCAELQQLWVDPAWRGHSLGTRLLRRFEAHAAGRGCTLVYLTTFSFQAPAFYRRCGYAEVRRIAGFAPGVERLDFERRLDAGSAG
jgi:GNAT superfamily N-acetyltransferase